MPQIIIRGILAEQVSIIEKSLVEELSSITETDTDDFTVEVFQTERIKDGEITSDYPFVEIKWFDRGQEIQDRSALEITKKFDEIGVTEVDIFFTHLKKENYYYKGKHY
ncbi:MAG: DUF1904 family protein [Clostridia bacterium]